MDGRDTRMLRDYALPQAWGITLSIVRPMIEANNLKLIPTLVAFVDIDQFGRHP